MIGSAALQEPDIDQLARSVMRPDALHVFANNMEKVYEFWKMLHTMTSIPNDTPDTNAFILKAFQFIQNTMVRQDLPPQLCRLVHVALTNMTARFGRAIAVNRKRGRVRSRSGYRNAAIVMDLFLEAHGFIADRVHAKKQLNRRMQTSRWWTHLASGCPLLLVVYSDAAESLIANRKVSNMILEALGSRLLASGGPSLIQASHKLQALAETDVQSDTSEAHAVLKEVIGTKTMLLSGMI
ncbi:hypothetical protein QL093DRAFT_2105438 [Fusarium oxysporum]|nr:hypothetical protein QL093DRAFT_2105438 [Fusarium oxysporum]